MIPSKCDVKRCRQLSAISIHSSGSILNLCDEHWNQSCEETKSSTEMKEWLQTTNNRILRRPKQ